MKHRHHQQKIIEMPRCQPGIVGHVDVAGRCLPGREGIAQVPNGFGHRIDVPGRTCHGLCQHAAFGIKDACRDVSAFTDNRAECSPDKSLALFFDRGKQPVPHKS